MLGKHSRSSSEIETYKFERPLHPMMHKSKLELWTSKLRMEMQANICKRIGLVLSKTDEALLYYDTEFLEQCEVVKTETKGLETFFQVINELIIIGYPSRCVFMTHTMTT